MPRGHWRKQRQQQNGQASGREARGPRQRQPDCPQYLENAGDGDQKASVRKRWRHHPDQVRPSPAPVSRRGQQKHEAERDAQRQFQIVENRDSQQPGAAQDRKGNYGDQQGNHRTRSLADPAFRREGLRKGLCSVRAFVALSLNQIAKRKAAHCAAFPVSYILLALVRTDSACPAPSSSCAGSKTRPSCRTEPSSPSCRACRLPSHPFLPAHSAGSPAPR